MHPLPSGIFCHAPLVCFNRIQRTGNQMNRRELRRKANRVKPRQMKSMTPTTQTTIPQWSPSCSVGHALLDDQLAICLHYVDSLLDTSKVKVLSRLRSSTGYFGILSTMRVYISEWKNPSWSTATPRFCMSRKLPTKHSRKN